MLSGGSASTDTKLLLVVQSCHHDKGKPASRRGRKAHGPPKEVAGLPKGDVYMGRTTRGSAGTALNMVSISVERRYGNTLILSSVTAPSIEQALRRAGEGARVVFPIDGEAFFASAKEAS